MNKANQFVEIKKKRNFNLILGKIAVAFLFDGKLWFAVKNCVGEYMSHLGTYFIQYQHFSIEETINA